MGSVPSSPSTADPRLAVADAELRTPHQQRVFERHRLHEEALEKQRSLRRELSADSLSEGATGLATPTVLDGPFSSRRGVALDSNVAELREKEGSLHDVCTPSDSVEAPPTGSISRQPDTYCDPRSFLSAHDDTNSRGAGEANAQTPTKGHISTSGSPHGGGESSDREGNSLTREGNIPVESSEPFTGPSVLSTIEATGGEGDLPPLLAVSTTPGFPQPVWRRADHDEVGGFRESDVLGRILTTRTISSFFRSVDSGDSTASEYGVCSTTPSMSPAFATPSRQRSAIRQEDSTEHTSLDRRGSDTMEPHPLSPASQVQESPKFRVKGETGLAAEEIICGLPASRLANDDREKHTGESKRESNSWIGGGEKEQPEGDQGRFVSPHHPPQRPQNAAEEEERDRTRGEDIQYDRGALCDAGDGDLLDHPRKAERDLSSNTLTGDESIRGQSSAPHGNISDISQSSKESTHPTATRRPSSSSSSGPGTAGGEVPSGRVSLSWMDQIRHALSQTAFLGPLGIGTDPDVESEEDEEEHHEDEPEDLDDSELLLLQGVHVYRTPPETLANAPHGSEPCNVLVCVEPENPSVGGTPSSTVASIGGGGAHSSHDTNVPAAATTTTTGSSSSSSSHTTTSSLSGSTSTSSPTSSSFFFSDRHCIEKSKDDGSAPSLEPVVFLPNDPLAQPANPPPLPELPLHGVVLFGADGGRTSYCRIRKDRHMTSDHGSRFSSSIQKGGARGNSIVEDLHDSVEGSLDGSAIEKATRCEDVPRTAAAPLPLIMRSNSALAALGGGGLKRGKGSSSGSSSDKNTPLPEGLDGSIPQIMSPVKEADEHVVEEGDRSIIPPAEEEQEESHRQHEPLSPSDSQFLDLSEGDRMVTEKNASKRPTAKDEEWFRKQSSRSSRTGLFSMRRKNGDTGEGGSSSRDGHTKAGHSSSSRNQEGDSDVGKHDGERKGSLQRSEEADGEDCFEKEKRSSTSSEFSGENFHGIDGPDKHFPGGALSTSSSGGSTVAPSSSCSSASSTSSLPTTSTSSSSADSSRQTAVEPRSHLSSLGQLMSRTSGSVVARGARSWAHTQYANFQQRTVSTLRLQRKRTSELSHLPSSGGNEAAASHSNRNTAGGKRSSAEIEKGGGEDQSSERQRQGGGQGGQSWWTELQRSVTEFFGPQPSSASSTEASVTNEEQKKASADGGAGGRKVLLEALSTTPANSTITPVAPLHTNMRLPIGFSFSPAGLLGPYHLGVLSYLCEANVINQYTPVAGASAGGLAVAAIGLNLAASNVMASVEHVCRDLIDRGTAHRLGKRLRKELNKLIPENCAEIVAKRPGKITVTYTHVFPYMQGEFVSSFYGKSDMMDCLIASCNIPFYLTKWPTVTCRGRQCVDGFFATKHKAFGCPDSGALRDIKVVPFYASTIRVSAAPEDCINPDLQLQDPQIVHYLRAKALLRARARVFREQMYDSSERHDSSLRETEESASGTDVLSGSNTSDGKTLRHSPRHRPLPSVCPLHGRTNSTTSPLSGLNHKRGSGVEESSTGGHSPQGGSNNTTRGGTICRKPSLSSVKYISPSAGMGSHEKTSNTLDPCTPSSSSSRVPITSPVSAASNPAGGASWSLVSGGTKTPSSSTVSKPGATAFPAAAAMAAKRGACAFDSIYACPICSPLGEVCPPSSLGYYYHDPLLPTFGTGVITTSAALADPENVASVAAMTAKKEKKPGKPSTNKGPSPATGGGGGPVDPMGAMTAAAATSGAAKTAAQGAAGDIFSAQGENRVVNEDEKGQKEQKVPSSADTTAAAVAGATAAVTGSPDSNPKLGKEALLRRSTVRQRRRVRECHSSGGLCMKAGCGCSTLPPLLRLCCSTQELLQIALEASPDATLRELFDVGRADAYRWLVLEYIRCEDRLIEQALAREAAAAAASTPSTETSIRPAVATGGLRARWSAMGSKWGGGLARKVPSLWGTSDVSGSRRVESDQVISSEQSPGVEKLADKKSTPPCSTLQEALASRELTEGSGDALQESPAVLLTGWELGEEEGDSTSLPRAEDDTALNSSHRASYGGTHHTRPVEVPSQVHDAKTGSSSKRRCNSVPPSPEVPLASQHPSRAEGNVLPPHEALKTSLGSGDRSSSSSDKDPRRKGDEKPLPGAGTLEGLPSKKRKNNCLPGGGAQAMLRLLKQAPLEVQYSHIYTHSHSWNGDGSRCMLPGAHPQPSIFTRKNSRRNSGHGGGKLNDTSLAYRLIKPCSMGPMMPPVIRRLSSASSQKSKPRRQDTLPENRNGETEKAGEGSL
ncbi:patatin family protein [Cystoisospora suis]|uniref:Patatin family protein n=1 Tax=Cystoisospora suis TaxID=483139 RepID=A0A2C6L9P7_9APIC|nr:patatin family protein [Cystoisospora suis]